MLTFIFFPPTMQSAVFGALIGAGIAGAAAAAPCIRRVVELAIKAHDLDVFQQEINVFVAGHGDERGVEEWESKVVEYQHKYRNITGESISQV